MQQSPQYALPNHRSLDVFQSTAGLETAAFDLGLAG
jgi:hypothetical protein